MKGLLLVVVCIIKAGVVHAFIHQAIPPFATKVASRSLTSQRAIMAMADVIIGSGRIGLALYELGGKTGLIVGREDPIPADGTGPIYVCTRNDDLENVIERTPAGRRQDLVFLQNGILEPILEKHGLTDNTQGLIYFAVSKKGEKPIDGVTDLNPEGLTSATGKWAEQWASLLAAGGLTCHVVPKDIFTARAFEKHLWICCFMAVGAKHNCSVGEVVNTHKEEVSALIRELIMAVETGLGVKFEPGVAPRLLAYARSVAGYPTAVKEFKWRNGFFKAMSAVAQSAGLPDPCPLHTALVAELGVV